MSKIRVVVADDHIYAAEGMQKIVSEAEDMECVGSTTVLLELPALVKNLCPDVLVLDLDWLGDRQAGIDILPDLRNIQPNLPAVAVTVYPELIELAREAKMYPLNKGFSKHQLLDTIRWAHRKPNNNNLSTSPPIDVIRLTPAERSVLALLAKGMSDLEIAEKQGRAIGTVKKHVSNILKKLGVKNRTEAAVMAGKYNLIAEP